VSVSWDDDPPGSFGQIGANAGRLAERILREAPNRQAPTVSDAKAWHAEIYQGVGLPEPYFAGQVRDSDPSYPELDGYEVEVARADGSEPPCWGSDAALVLGDLDEFERLIQDLIAKWDARIPAGVGDAGLSEADLLNLVIFLATVHGEWIRIHPFANGNGRTARLWVHYLLARYDLPRFIQIVPRPPDQRYALAAQYSLCDDDDMPLTVLFLELIADSL